MNAQKAAKAPPKKEEGKKAGGKDTGLMSAERTAEDNDSDKMSDESVIIDDSQQDFV